MDEQQKRSIYPRFLSLSEQVQRAVDVYYETGSRWALQRACELIPDMHGSLDQLAGIINEELQQFLTTREYEKPAHTTPPLAYEESNLAFALIDQALAERSLPGQGDRIARSTNMEGIRG